MSTVNAPVASAVADGRAEPTSVQVASVEVVHGIAADCSAVHPTETSDVAVPHLASASNASRHSAVDNCAVVNCAVVNSAAQASWPSSSHSSLHSPLPSSLDWAVQVFQLPLAAGRDGAQSEAALGRADQANPATVPVIVIDHFYPDVAALRAAACEPSAEFVRDAANFYPGARRAAPAQYQQFLSQLQPLLQNVYGQTPWGGARPWQVLPTMQN